MGMRSSGRYIWASREARDARACVRTYRQRERQRERERQTDRQTDRKRQTERDIQKESDGLKETNRQLETNRQKETTDREKERKRCISYSELQYKYLFVLTTEIGRVIWLATLPDQLFSNGNGNLVWE